MDAVVVPRVSRNRRDWGSFVCMPCDSARGSRGGGRGGGASRGAAPIRDPAAGLRRGGRRSVPDRAVPRAFGFFGSGAPANGTNGGSRDSCSGIGGASPSRASAPRPEHRWRCLRASPRRAALLRGPSGVSWRDAPDGAARPSRRESGPHSLAVAPCARPGRARKSCSGDFRPEPVRTRRFRTARAWPSDESHRSRVSDGHSAPQGARRRAPGSPSENRAPSGSAAWECSIAFATGSRHRLLRRRVRVLSRDTGVVLAIPPPTPLYLSRTR